MFLTQTTARSMFTLSITALMLVVLTPDARAASSFQLESNLPVELEDAFPQTLSNINGDLSYSYERIPGDGDVSILMPEIEYGAWSNGEVDLIVPVIMGPGDRTGSGDIEVGAKQNVFGESMVAPAVSFTAKAALPTGKDSAGVDPGVGLLLSKRLPASSWDHLVHLNFESGWNTEKRNEERSQTWKTVAGYQANVTDSVSLVADYAFGEEKKEGDRVSLAEVGALYQINSLHTVSAAIGAALGDDQRDWKITLGYQAQIPAL